MNYSVEMEMLAGLVGALIGGAAAILGTYLTSILQRRAEDRAKADRLKVAARAFRDDFYTMQSRLAEAARSGGSLRVNDLKKGQLGSLELFLPLAEGLLGLKEWSDIAGARRAYIAILEAADRDECPSESDLRSWYWRLQRSREALALLDPDWPAGLHSGHDAMGPRPHEFHRIDYGAFRLGARGQVIAKRPRRFAWKRKTRT